MPMAISTVALSPMANALLEEHTESEYKPVSDLDEMFKNKS
jgi:hypothetical protein